VACFHPNLDHRGTATAGLVRLLSDVLAPSASERTRPN
jgi:hypothetical protein